MAAANMNQISTRRMSFGLATGTGLLLAMFGTPLFLWLFKLDVGDADSLPLYLGRELVVFLMAAALLLLVRNGEKLPFSSIGWHTDRLGRSALWGLFGVVLAAIGLAACIAIAQAMHWKLGLQEPPKFNPPLWAMTITVLRAGITEELFYRGYALERLRALTGSAWIAALLTIVPFALFHYRQGPAGILIAGVAAVILTALYLKRRDLPAVMLTHFTVDFIPNVLLPLLGTEP
jgi:membrane protease YdiL (CAAX protease family)